MVEYMGDIIYLIFKKCKTNLEKAPRSSSSVPPVLPSHEHNGHNQGMGHCIRHCSILFFVWHLIFLDITVEHSGSLLTHLSGNLSN